MEIKIVLNTENKWGWTNSKFCTNEISRFENSHVSEKAKSIGQKPIDGDDDDIYSQKIAVNQLSFLNDCTKFSKSRPPPTYIEYNEYKNSVESCSKSPMKDLKIRGDINRIECINEDTNQKNRGLKAYAMKQIAKNFFRGVTNFSLPAYVFDPVSNVSQFMNNFRTAPYFMQKASRVSVREPYERIKLITALCVSSLHQNISFKRAFNPILGETYEGYFTLDEEIIKKDCNIGTGICFSPIITKPNQNIDDSFDQITDFSI